MCQIYCVETTDAHITDAELDSAYQFNRDGVGAVWFANGRPYVAKWLGKDFDQFKDFYHHYIKGTVHMVHLRFATEGPATLDNCHPFQIADDVFLAHNGTLAVDTYDDKSDTVVFVEMAREFPPKWWRYETLCDILEDWITWSKFAIFDCSDGEPTFYYLNAHKGVELRDGVWASCADYLPFEQRRLRSSSRFDDLWPARRDPAYADYDSMYDDGVTTRLMLESAPDNGIDILDETVLCEGCEAYKETEDGPWIIDENMVIPDDSEVYTFQGGLYCPDCIKILQDD